MSVLEDLKRVIEPITPKYAFILKNGQILLSGIEETNLLKITSFIPNICNDLKVGAYLHKSKLYIYRVTENFLIIILTDLKSTVLDRLIDDIKRRFIIKIEKEFANLPNAVTSIVNHIILAIARDAGPEPILIPDGLNEAEAFRITMKAMLNLTGEIEGASKAMMSTMPFSQFNALGIVYLYQIPYKKARGEAYDASIILLVDYKDRAIVYEKHDKFEKVFEEAVSLMIEIFNENIDENGKWIKKERFNEVTNFINNYLDKIPLRISNSEEIKSEMMNFMKDLNHL